MREREVTVLRVVIWQKTADDARVMPAMWWIMWSSRV